MNTYRVRVPVVTYVTETVQASNEVEAVAKVVGDVAKEPDLYVYHSNEHQVVIGLCEVVLVNDY